MDRSIFFLHLHHKSDQTFVELFQNLLSVHYREFSDTRQCPCAEIIYKFNTQNVKIHLKRNSRIYMGIISG